MREGRKEGMKVGRKEKEKSESEIGSEDNVSNKER